MSDFVMELILGILVGSFGILFILSIISAMAAMFTDGVNE